ncbi:MAG: serine-type D-Ala-D-Ala carboxypeptidase/endopeptidase [Humisphaera sp.]|nr:serine-type D-Ala-D-Ala carboxypeptidase/endopeptidase [Humisphaera sp.]
MKAAATVVGIVLLTWCCACADAATAAAITREQVDAIVRPATKVANLDRVAVGTIDASGRAVYGYGNTPPDGRTLFEIGSVTKTFTATLLADMVLRGDVTLDTPVADLLPSGVHVPSKDGVAITLLLLANHRSGLPRMPEKFEPDDPTNPYADYSAEKLYESVSTTELHRRPGQLYEYSNLGTGLLGHALARKASMGYEQMVIARICKPLGMNDTKITLDGDDRTRLAPGHDLMSVPMSNWDFDSLAGAGGIRSNVNDMLQYVAANLALIDSPLCHAMRMTHERRADVDAKTDIAMGWHIGKRTGARWHSGQTGGYHSFVAFIPEKKLGVVVLCNTGSAMVDTIGTQLLCTMLGERVEPIQPNPPTR